MSHEPLTLYMTNWALLNSMEWKPEPQWLYERGADPHYYWLVCQRCDKEVCRIIHPGPPIWSFDEEYLAKRLKVHQRVCAIQKSIRDGQW